MLDWMHWTWQSALGFGLLFAMLGGLAILDSRVPGYPRKGVLPMETTRGDRVFLSVVQLIAVVLAWLRLVPDWSLLGALAVASVTIAATMRWG